MTTNSVKNPPSLEKSISFEIWEKKVELWKSVTDLKPEQQGPALVLALTAKAQDQVLELPTSDIKATDGVTKIIAKLATIYKKDTVDSAYEAFENFIYFKRPEEMKMKEFVVEFEKRHVKAKSHGCELSESILGFLLLNQAQLAKEKKELVKATLDKLEYQKMKEKLLKVFGGMDNQENSEVDGNIKVEQINLGEEEEVLYGRNFGYNRGYNRGNRGFFSGRGFARGRGQNQQSRGFPRKTNWTANKNYYDNKKKIRCEYCESICHTTRDCQEKVYFYQEDEEEDFTYDVVLYQSNLITPEDFTIFLSEASVSAILDSGASSSVAGKKWLDSYVTGLPDKAQKQIEYENSNARFKFGSGKQFPSLSRAKIPAFVGSRKVMISTDIVNTDIPLLLSKNAMKRAETEINFLTDTVKMFGEEQEVIVTTSGHYALPLNNTNEILRRMEKQEDIKVNLLAESNKQDNDKIALKLHSQFGHPPKAKLVDLLRRAGKGEDKELVRSLERVEDECQICQQYAKPSPRPVVGMTHATEFNETVAMDLFFWQGKIILHAIDHLTRFSAARICKTKQPSEIIKAICESWITIFGAPGKFLTDNGGEFANEQMTQMAEAMNIRVMTTSAESPWSNGLVERHNATLKHMLDKISAEKEVQTEIALAWAVQAKNSLANVHGFSPAQLTFGQNPNLPGVLSDKPPALEEREVADIIATQLRTMRTARQAFIKAESEEKIKRALRHNIRPSAKNKFIQGDLVYYKRNDSRKWRGPGKVIGTESSTILIKHGAQYVRAHVCRVLPVKGTYYDSQGEPKQNGFEERSHEENRHSVEKQQEDEIIEEEEEKNSQVEQVEATAQNQERQVEYQSETSNLEDTELQSPIEDLVFEDALDLGETGEPVETNVTDKSNVNMKKGQNISFRTQDGLWHNGEVMRRTGKVTGKYRNNWAIKDSDSGTIQDLDIERDWIEWKVRQDESEEATVEEIMVVDKAVEDEKARVIREAKEVELKKWVDEKVYEDVEDIGQECLSTTWVMTEKLVDGKSVVKARLVVRGFEEVEKARADSPTCAKEDIRLLLTVAAAREWKIHSLDVKAAFLQGKRIEREVYLKAPKEKTSPGVVWKLRKVVYGLSDASRSWYLRVEEAMLELGLEKMKMDNAVFLWRKASKVEGIVTVHVDDMLYFGAAEFHNIVMNRFKLMFKISREEESSFKYLGVNILQDYTGITLEQKAYVEGLSEDLVNKSELQNKERLATESEKKSFRHGVGQLGWLESTTKPEIGFVFCQLSTIQSAPRMKHFATYSKAVKDLKSRASVLRINKVNLKEIELRAYSDASLGNLECGGSQMGYVVLLCDKQDMAVPIAWGSKKTRRVARSTLAAETIAACEAVDNAVVVKAAVEEVLGGHLPPIKLYVDNKSLSDAVRTTNVLTDKRLRIEMAQLREMVDNGSLLITLVPTDK